MAPSRGQARGKVPDKQPQPGSAGSRASGNAGLPDILNYSNYRQYLADYYQAQKAVNPKFSLRYFAAKASFPSHGLIKFVMEGKRNLSQKTLVKLAAALELAGERLEYFQSLVFFNQARSLSEKRLYYDRLLSASGRSTFRTLQYAQLEIFRKWYTIAIRELAQCKGFRNNPGWIADQFLPEIAPASVAESLADLLAGGLLRKTANGLKAADPDITTDDEIKSIMVMGYHEQMIRLAAWAQQDIPGKDREISSACFSIRASELPNLKKQLQLMRRQLRNFAAKPGEGDRVVQVNLQMFPLTRGG